MGIRRYLDLLPQWFPPAPIWSEEEIPDLSGKVMIVTGGNAGIGKETVRALLSHNAKVYMASRSRDRAIKAIAELKQSTGKEAIFLQIDLSSLRSVRKASEEFLSKENELHVLFNNGGVMVPPYNQFTEDGYDMQFGTNVLGHYFLTRLLMPALLAAIRSSPDHKARVITTSSTAHYLGNLRWATFVEGPARRALSNGELYNQSKFGNVVVARELARQYADEGIVSISLTPGNVKTEIGRHISTPFRQIGRIIMYPTPLGALTQLWAGTAPEAAECNGKYLIPWARIGSALPETQNPKTGARLWAWLEEQVQDHLNEVSC